MTPCHGPAPSGSPPSSAPRLRAPRGPGPTRRAKPRTSATPTLLMPDHFGDQLAPVPALMAAAAATTSLRVGALVFGNDYRHPVVLAKEAATLDVLCDGRFELSLGAGWMRTDYDQSGMTYDHPAVRVDRLEEAIKVVPGLLEYRGPVQFPRGTLRGPRAHARAAAGPETRTPADRGRRWEAGPVDGRPARRHRRHQRESA